MANTHELHHIDEKNIENLPQYWKKKWYHGDKVLKFESKPWGEMFNLEDISFQLHKVGTLQMHILQNIGTKKWDTKTPSMYATASNKCQWVILQNTYVSSIHIWICKVNYEGKHLHVCSCNFELQEVHAHHTQII